MINSGFLIDPVLARAVLQTALYLIDCQTVGLPPEYFNHSHAYIVRASKLKLQQNITTYMVQKLC